MDGPWARQYQLEETDENGNGTLDPILDEEGNPVIDQEKLNRYQYNGKELTQDLGLNWNDYGARWYDPAIGRFSAVDPLSEAFYSFATYHYGYNNPIRYIDPNGMAATDYSYDWQSGNYKDGSGNIVGWGEVNNYLTNSGYLTPIQGSNQVEVESRTVSEVRHEGDYGDGNFKTIQSQQAVTNFAKSIEEISALNSKKKALITIFVEIPYSDFTAYALSSGQAKGVERLKALYRNLPSSLREGVFEALDKTVPNGFWGRSIPKLEMQGLVEEYQSALDMLKASGIKVDYNIKTKVELKGSKCFWGKYPCSSGHSPRAPTKIYFRFKGFLHRA